LTLFVALIFANDADDALPPNDSAVFTQSLY